MTLLQSRFGGGSKQLQHDNRQCGGVWCTRLSFVGKGIKAKADGRANELLAGDSRDHGMLAGDAYAMLLLAWPRVVGLISWLSLLQSSVIFRS